jgi:hypothetical protein
MLGNINGVWLMGLVGFGVDLNLFPHQTTFLRSMAAAMSLTFAGAV